MKRIVLYKYTTTINESKKIKSKPDIETTCMNGIWTVVFVIGKVIKLQYLLCKGIYEGCTSGEKSV
jgi:hypothetical protein